MSAPNCACWSSAFCGSTVTHPTSKRKRHRRCWSRPRCCRRNGRRHERGVSPPVAADGASRPAAEPERWSRSETSAFGEHAFPCFPKGASPSRGRERRPDYTLASRPTRGSGNGLGFNTKWIKRKKWTGALLPDLRPGFLVLLEGIHFHPTLEDGNAIDRVAGVDEFLNQVGERSFEEAAGFVEALFLVLAHRLAVALDEGFDAVLRKHRHPDELGMRLVRRQVLADFDHAILLLRHDVAEQIAFSRRVLEHDQV